MIKITPLPKHIQECVNKIRKTASQHNVTVILSENRFVDVGDKQCNGYFEDGNSPTLAVACGQPIKQWLPILIHESCHMDQWIEDIPLWNNNLIGNYEAMDIVDLWCSRKVELTNVQLSTYTKLGREIELDCEKRTAAKILEYNVPINITEFIQKANSYVYFYTMIKDTRSWYKTNFEPYNIKTLWSKMPPHFYNDYDKISPEIKKLYIKLVNGKLK